MSEHFEAMCDEGSEHARIELERKMEAQGLPESDRDEVRTLHEFLKLRKQKAPIPADMQRWLVGRDVLTPDEDYGHIHELKCWPIYFDPILSGQKTFEFRKDDRAFIVGDLLFLKEWDQSSEEYTSRTAMRRVTYIARGGLIPEGYCVMSIVPVSP